VLHFPYDEIRHHLARAIRLTKATINQYGGLQYMNDPQVFRRLATESEQQSSLFE
jgi:hypothetical protein